VLNNEGGHHKVSDMNTTQKVESSINGRRNAMKKVEDYVPLIEDGIPIPERIPTVYTRKIVTGEIDADRRTDQARPKCGSASGINWKVQENSQFSWASYRLLHRAIRHGGKSLGAFTGPAVRLDRYISDG